MNVIPVNSDSVSDTSGDDGKKIFEQEFDMESVTAEIKDIDKRSSRMQGRVEEVMGMLATWADRLKELSDQIEREKTAKEGEKAKKTQERTDKKNSRRRSTARTMKIHKLTQEISRLGNKIRDLDKLLVESQRIHRSVLAAFNSLIAELNKSK